MSYRTLDIAAGVSGGVIQLLEDPKRARNIHVTVLNPTAVTHAAFFANSRRELQENATFGINGFAIVAVPNTVANATVGTIAYSSFILQGWVGDLWAASDVAGLIQVDVYEGAGPEN